MSIKIYNASRWIYIKNPTQKSVYMALAGLTDDLGVVKFPIEAKQKGGKSLALVTGFTPRAIHKALNALEQSELITRFNSGPHGSVIHVIVPESGSGSITNYTEPHSGYHELGSVNPRTPEKEKADAIRSRLLKVCGSELTRSIPSEISLELFLGFMEVRLQKDAPNTNTALGILIEQLQGLIEVGKDPNDKLRQCILNGWTSLESISKPGIGPGQRSKFNRSDDAKELSNNSGTKSFRQRERATSQGDHVGKAASRVISKFRTE